MPTEKVIVPIFLAIVAGLITAGLAFVKLVNDKEGKTTDYRHAWTQSARQAFAELISNIHLLANGINRRLEWQARVDDLADHAAGEPAGKGFVHWLGSKMTGAAAPATESRDPSPPLESEKVLRERVAAEETLIRAQWRDLHKSYALTRLHFKVADADFQKIERSFENIRAQLNELETLAGTRLASTRDELGQNIERNADQLTADARLLLKNEWEQIKRGERTFQATKKFASYFAGVVMVIVGLLLALIVLTSSRAAPPAPGTAACAATPGLPAAAPAPGTSVQQIVTIHGHAEPRTTPVKPPKTTTVPPPVAPLPPTPVPPAAAPGCQPSAAP